jgi:hypothetical protein
MGHRIKVTGVRKRPISADQLSLALWLIAKSELRLKREREAKEKAKRREREQ